MNSGLSETVLAVIAEQMLDTIGYGGIALADVADLVIRE